MTDGLPRLLRRGVSHPLDQNLLLSIFHPSRLGPPRSTRSNPEGKEGMENTLCAWRVGRGVNRQNRYCPTDRAFEVSSVFGHLSFGMMCLFGIVQWHRSRSPSFLDLCNTKVTYLCSPRSTPRRRHPLRRDMQWRQCRNPHQRTLYLPQRATNNRSKQSNVSCAKSTTAPESLFVSCRPSLQ